MDAHQPGAAPAGSVKQLRRTARALQSKLAIINRQLTDDPPSLDGSNSLTFTLAHRNFIQGNLERVERQILLARISNASSEHDSVGIGNVVYIQRGNDIRAIMLIPANDTNSQVEYVPANSTLGKALRGKRVGQNVVLKTPLGQQNFGILRIV